MRPEGEEELAGIVGRTILQKRLESVVQRTESEGSGGQQRPEQRWSPKK